MTPGHKPAKTATVPAAILCAAFFTCGIYAAEHRLTGEYAAKFRVKRGDHVRVVYASTIREGGQLSVGAGSSLVLSGSAEKPGEGRSRLIVYGFLDLMGSTANPVEIKGLNSARIVIGNAEGRDDRRPRRTLIHVRIARSVFRNVGVVVRNGIVNIEESVFINSPVFIDGGKVRLERCSLLNPQGSALEIVRSDSYPVVQGRYLDITGSTVGLNISKQTVRDQRMPLVITDCNFRDNSTHITHDETKPLVVRGCFFDGMKAGEVMQHIEYSDKPDRNGRIIVQAVRRNPVKQAGAGLVRDGSVELKAPEQEEEEGTETAGDEGPVEPGG